MLLPYSRRMSCKAPKWRPGAKGVLRESLWRVARRHWSMSVSVVVATVRFSNCKLSSRSFGRLPGGSPVLSRRCCRCVIAFPFIVKPIHSIHLCPSQLHLLRRQLETRCTQHQSTIKEKSAGTLHLCTAWRLHQTPCVGPVLAYKEKIIALVKQLDHEGLHASCYVHSGFRV